MKPISSHRNRFLLLVLAMLSLLILSWKFAIGKTLALLKQNEELKAEIIMAQSNAVDVEQIQDFLAQKSGQSRSTHAKQETLLDSINHFAKSNQLMITNFDGVKESEIGNLDVNYQSIELQGSYDSILRLVYYIEQETQLRAVNHLKFYIHENRKTREKNLRAKLYLLDAPH